jgi:hypothetical protein
MNGRLLESSLRQISSEQYEIEQITGNHSLLGEIRLKIRQFLSNFPLSKTFPQQCRKLVNTNPLHVSAYFADYLAEGSVTCGWLRKKRAA